MSKREMTNWTELSGAEQSAEVHRVVAESAGYFGFVTGEKTIVSNGHFVAEIPARIEFGQSQWQMPKATTPEQVAAVLEKRWPKDVASSHSVQLSPLLEWAAGHAEEDCTKCRGKGSMRCRNCNGGGTAECTCDCGDVHDSDCNECDDGRITCECVDPSPRQRYGQLVGASKPVTITRDLLARALRLIPSAVDSVRLAVANDIDAITIEGGGTRALLMTARDLASGPDATRTEFQLPEAVL